MDPHTSGLHPGLFDDDLLGIGFYTVWEAGLIFSGNVGTGIVFARNPTNGTWSSPAAVGLSGIGWGLMGGASRKTIVYLIYDYFTLQSMSGEHGAMLRAQAESCLFFWGRTAEASAIVSARGVGTNIALSYSRGIFVGISIEGALCKSRNRVNERFYGRRISTSDILFGGGPLELPDNTTLLPEVYDKLKRLCDGLSVYTPSPEERFRVSRTRPLVDKEGEEALKEEIIEFVEVSDELHRSATSLLLEKDDSSEIEISDNMDIFAELVDKEDELRHYPHISIPPPLNWPVPFVPSADRDDNSNGNSGNQLRGRISSFRSRSTGSLILRRAEASAESTTRQSTLTDFSTMTFEAEVDVPSRGSIEKRASDGETRPSP